jgi:hypothetical protein
MDIASDNILEIINDKNHPQHFAASKYVLTKYKSELDDVLDTQGEEIEIEGTGRNVKSPVRIVFSSSPKKNEE